MNLNFNFLNFCDELIFLRQNWVQLKRDAVGDVAPKKNHKGYIKKIYFYVLLRACVCVGVSLGVRVPEYLMSIDNFSDQKKIRYLILRWRRRWRWWWLF